MRITIPGLPPRDASPNARVHYMKLANVKRNQKDLMIASVLELMPMDRPNEPWEKAHLTITFRASDKRRRDIDNLLSASKAYVDGLVAAGVIIDDSSDNLSYSLYYEKDKEHAATIFDIEEAT
jgi:Holliday junction resolvase RusA-like endonuclease